MPNIVDPDLMNDSNLYREKQPPASSSSSSSFSTDDESGLETTPNTSRSWRNLTIASLPVVAVIVFLSRPIMALITRESCYMIRGSSDFSNPISGAWHAAWSLYECEWVGNLGFNWPSVAEWLSTRAYTIGSSLGILGGVYATWKTLTSRFNPNALNEDERSRVKALARHIQISEPPLSQMTEPDTASTDVFIQPKVFGLSKLFQEAKERMDERKRHRKNKKQRTQEESAIPFAVRSPEHVLPAAKPM